MPARPPQPGPAGPPGPPGPGTKVYDLNGDPVADKELKVVVDDNDEIDDLAVEDAS